MPQYLPSRRPGRTTEYSLAEVAELADAHGSGPCTRKGVGVRVPSSAPLVFLLARYVVNLSVGPANLEREKRWRKADDTDSDRHHLLRCGAGPFVFSTDETHKRPS